MTHLSTSEQSAIRQLTDVIRWHAPADQYRLYLFGSRARGQGKPNSDYDIAIEGPTELPWSDRMRILSAWEGLPYRADLVDLHEVDPRFAREIQADAIPI